jgi:hypothetical protein
MRERGLNRLKNQSGREHSKVPVAFHLAYFMTGFFQVFSATKKAISNGAKGIFGSFKMRLTSVPQRKISWQLILRFSEITPT